MLINLKKIILGVSCDLSTLKIRMDEISYNKNKFESNIKEASNLIIQINCTVSLLNILELNEIYDYYMDNFGKPIRGCLRRFSHELSIRNLKINQ